MADGLRAPAVKKKKVSKRRTPTPQLNGKKKPKLKLTKRYGPQF